MVKCDKRIYEGFYFFIRTNLWHQVTMLKHLYHVIPLRETHKGANDCNFSHLQEKSMCLFCTDRENPNDIF